MDIFFYLDSAALLIREVEIISAVQEERFLRKKYDSRFPENILNKEALLELVREVWNFLKIRKKYWLATLIITITIILMGALFVFTQRSVVTPLIYFIF